MNKKLRLIYIEWQDAVGNAQWFTKTEAEGWHDLTQYTIREVGYLVKEDARGITLAGRYKVEDDNTCEQFGNLQWIPKPWILKRVDLTKFVP